MHPFSDLARKMGQGIAMPHDRGAMRESIRRGARGGPGRVSYPRRRTLILEGTRIRSKSSASWVAGTLAGWGTAAVIWVFQGCGGSNASLPSANQANDAAVDDGADASHEGGGDATSSTSDAADAGAPDSLVPDSGGADVLACNTLANTAPSVTIGGIAGPLPAGTGGNVPAGTFFVTAYAFYSVDGGATLVGHTVRQTAVVTAVDAHTLDIETVIGFDSSPDYSNHWTLTTSGASFKVNGLCPNMITFGGTYTWDNPNRQLHWYNDDGSETVFTMH
jgi:hypothetical protein